MPHNSLLTRYVSGNAGFAALLMLFFGYMRLGTKGTSTSALYNFSVPALAWTLLIGGALLAIAAFLTKQDIHVGLLLDSGTSALCGLIFLAIGLFWTVRDGVNLDSLLIIFGVIFLRSAKEVWSLYRLGPDVELIDEATAVSGFPVDVIPLNRPREIKVKMRAAHDPPQHESPNAPAAPLPPAAVSDPALPKPHEPPPPDGYLAALGRAKRDQRPSE